MSYVKTVLAAVLVSVMALSAPVGVQAKTKLTPVSYTHLHVEDIFLESPGCNIPQKL